MDLSTPGKVIQPSQPAFSGLGPLRPISCSPGVLAQNGSVKPAQRWKNARQASTLCTRTCTKMHTPSRPDASAHTHTHARACARLGGARACAKREQSFPRCLIEFATAILTRKKRVLQVARRTSLRLQNPHPLFSFLSPLLPPLL